MKKFPFLPLLHQDRHTSFSPLHLDKPLCLPSSKGSTPAGSLHLDWVISREEAFQNQWLTLHLFPNSSFVQKKPQQHMSKRLFFKEIKGKNNAAWPWSSWTETSKCWKSSLCNPLCLAASSVTPSPAHYPH